MNLSPIANRSFLHGEQKQSSCSPTSKLAYTTLDSLALKRTRLPLQLLPVDNDREASSKTKKSNPCTEAAPGKLFNVQVDATRHPEKCVSPMQSPALHEKQETAVEGGSGVDEEKFEKVTPSTHFDDDDDTEDSSVDFQEINQQPDNLTETKSLSDDYEKIELSISPVDVSIIEEKTSNANENPDEEPLYSSFINNLSEKNSTDLEAEDEPYSEDLNREKSSASSVFTNEEQNFGKKKKKKKKHFARNVFHFVPDYLVKGSKRTKKKKKSNLSTSLGSLKPLSVDSKITASSYSSRSLSRAELRYANISSPTNFVHVASATSPNLVLNENTDGFSLEQCVITHEQKCATLPLLVSRDKNFAGTIPRKREEETARKVNAIGDGNLKLEFLSELRARSAKMLEQSQQVKTGENGEAREGKRQEPLRESTMSLPRAELRANSSFLWSNRTKNLLENTRREKSRSMPIEVTDELAYDDVGPANLIIQEDDYDDVRSPMARVDSIYDDVIILRKPERSSTRRSREHEGLIMENNSAGSRVDGAEQGDGHYLLISNEYSSVDEEDTDETQDNGQGVYDDVGLPSVERVNSLYAGSMSSSILGVNSTNGKESEWEDLDDTATEKNDLSTETETVESSKNKSGRKWSTKVRRQRSRVSKKGSGSTRKSEAYDYVAVSLGSGSVLLVGCAEKIEEWSKRKSNDRTGEENLRRTQGLVQLRVIDLDEDMDTQETSCYIDEDNTSDDSTYESLHSSFQPDDSSTDTEIETETMDTTSQTVESVDEKISNRSAILQAPTKPNPPLPREASLTETLGRRIKMLRRTWSFTKGSLGRIRKRTSVDEEHSFEESKDSCNDHQNYESGRYFNFARHFKKSVTGFSTFYLNGYATNGSSDSTSTDNSYSTKEPTYGNLDKSESTHYSVLADQEPLYQFYAAAAARVDFDFSSDSYEEVEDIAPARSAVDLVKPGHRTLWCQTPQVLHSGLLDRLSTDQRNIQEAKFEILTSEASYLNSLRVLENEFLNDPSINEILTSTERDKLFGGIPSVLQASEQFLAELESVWIRDPMLHGLPDLLIKYAEKCLDIYVAYCSNQVTIDATLKDLKARKGLKFLETVSQIETRPACQSLSLHSFLMLPMQRITRLPLLADAVLSKLSVEHVDRSEWEKVLSSLSYAVAECNEGARAATKEAEMECLAGKLEYSSKIKPIVLKGKHLVKNGPVIQLLTKADTEYKLTFGKKFNKTPLYLLLLTDYLLVTKHKSNMHDETYTVIDTCKRNLLAFESFPEDSPFAGRNAMLLTLLENYSGRQVEYILTCESNTERQRWLEAASPSNRGLIGETLYESWDCPQVVALYCYTPNQPDELSLHPGDVINVLRKMPDGWFHGEKLLDGEQGWFPGNYAKEVASEHVRAKNLKQRHRLLTLSGSVLQRKTKQQSAIY